MECSLLQCILERITRTWREYNGLIGLGNVKIVGILGFSQKITRCRIGTDSVPHGTLEQKAQKAKHLLKFDEDECYFFVCGAGKVSAATLALPRPYKKSTLFISIRKKSCSLRYNKNQQGCSTFFNTSLWLLLLRPYVYETISEFIPDVTIKIFFLKPMLQLLMCSRTLYFISTRNQSWDLIMIPKIFPVSEQSNTGK